MLTHREEIDGLRAIAVIPVIFYHAGLRMYFSGGYVGVDIFFVISGYLITSLILSECEEGNFSLINFYERRCRRILPALFLILFLSSVCAYHLMLPEQLKEFGETLLSILFFGSNIYFWWKDDGYFSQLSDLNPLVHTWSLAVEEQFYLIFPIVCYLLHRNKLRLTVVLVVVSGLSLVLSQWGGNVKTKNIDQFQMFSQHPLASFYLPIGRIWELLLGSLLAFYSQTNNSDKYVQENACQI